MSTTKSGAELIAAERQRQINDEGWSHEHDDDHDGGQLAIAASCYAQSAQKLYANQKHYGKSGYKPLQPTNWPWQKEWWKPKGAIEDLVRAGALIAAEIDRLQRMSKS